MLRELLKQGVWLLQGLPRFQWSVEPNRRVEAQDEYKPGV